MRLAAWLVRQVGLLWFVNKLHCCFSREVRTCSRVKYHTTKEATMRELGEYVGKGWDIIATRTLRNVQPNGSFEDQIIYVLGEPVVKEQEFQKGWSTQQPSGQA